MQYVFNIQKEFEEPKEHGVINLEKTKQKLGF